ncbi:MAG: NADH-dependent [FeFe] hydrogenase, group A6 [Bacillota bacterium]
MTMINLTIDGKAVSVPKGTTILEAARQMGIHIPTLCHHPDQLVKAVCRVCVVEIEGQRTFQTACSYQVAEGMVVRTATPAIREARRMIVELILSRHPQDCLQCARNLNCELQTMAEQMGIREVRFDRKLRDLPVDESSPSIIRDPQKCILCRRCVEACHVVQSVGVLYPQHRGADSIVATPADLPLGSIDCTNCGQCIHACPVGAITEKDYTAEVYAAMADPTKHVVVQTAPAVRVAIGEPFGYEPGAVTTGKLAAALRRLGFDAVFDTDFTADLTILEEGHELIKRLTEGGILPMITSCSPGWIKFIEHNFPEELDHLSTCKSPQQMFGALAKTYYAQKMGIDPKNIYSVSVMPCTAKKFEITRPEMRDSGYQDVDAVLTTRELARMIRQAGIEFVELPDEEYDDPFGISTGAAVIFGATGGVMEAALRTAYEVVTKKALPDLNFRAVRGMASIKEAEVDLDGIVVRVAVAHGLANARKVMEDVATGRSKYHFIEVMACPGGCIGGGGQPIPTTNEIRQKRIKGIYQADEGLPIRKSHENPAIAKLYEDFLGHPLGERSHHLLHTHYTKRGK